MIVNRIHGAHKKNNKEEINFFSRLLLLTFRTLNKSSKYYQAKKKKNFVFKIE